MITKDTQLPTFEELTVEECELSSPYLKAAAFHLGKYCEAYNNEFILCQTEEKDPRKCINEGKGVTKCSMEFFRKVKKNCAAELKDHAWCLDHSHAEMKYRLCRKTQAVLDTCMLEKLNVARPPYGYFNEVRIHNTVRPKPPLEPPQVFPEALPEAPPDDLPRRGYGKYGSRWFGLF